MILSHQSIKKEIKGSREFNVGPCSIDIHLDQDAILWPFVCKICSISEYLTIPTDMMACIHDKSTLARQGISVQNTIAQPDWCGFLTLEITLNRFLPLRLKKGTKIAQVIFHKLDEPTAMPYEGKYQYQPNFPVKAKV